MLKLKLQLLGGRGSRSNVGGSSSNGGGGGSETSGGGGTFSSEAEFEKSLTGFNDPRFQEYSNALDEREQRVSEINSLSRFASNEGLGDWTRKSLESERQQAQDRLNNMPTNKTPAQLGEARGLTDQIGAINKILSITPTGQSSQGDVNILV